MAAIMEKKGFLDSISSVFFNEHIVGRVVEVDIDRIYPNPNQPRKYFSGDDLSELASSIKINGLIQPIIVRRVDMGYELIAGERRLRAVRMCGMTEIACIVAETTEHGSAMMSLVENMQRKNLNFFEEAEAISNMIELFDMTQEEIAVKLGKTQSAVANKLRLLRLSPYERKVITEYGFTERHARALLKIDNEQVRGEIIKEIFERKLNVDNTERLIESVIKHDNEMKRIKKCKGAFKDIRLFVNTINHAVEVMQAAGINAEVRKTKEKEYIEYVVRIPN